MEARGESINNNGSELLLNNHSTAEREHSQNPIRPDSVLANNNKDGSV